MSYFKQLVFISFLIVTNLISGISQDQGNIKTREIGFSIGSSTIQSRDTRISAITKKFRAPTFGFHSRTIKNDFKHEFVFNYTFKSKFDRTQLLDFISHRPDFYYSLQRKTDFGWIGGHINLSTLLTFPISSTGHFSNSPISYTMAATLGPSVSFDRNLGDSDRWSIAGDAHVGLINYVIRPAFGHPYPERFLQPEVFTPTREGMAPKLLTSGKLETINKYQSVKIRFGVYYLVDSRVKLGVVGSVDYVNSKDNYQATYLNQNLAVSASYIY